MRRGGVSVCVRGGLPDCGTGLYSPLGEESTLLSEKAGSFVGCLRLGWWVGESLGGLGGIFGR